MVTIRTVAGPDIARHIADLARLRIAVFRAFPYLYDGDTDYEQRYLATYAQARDSVLLLAFDGDTVVGASTGIPLADETDAIRRPWSEAGIDPADVFYLGESVLLPAYRGFGLGHRFFDGREAHARGLGRFALTSFCAVERDDDHPDRPAGYRALREFWTSRGYRPMPDVTCTMDWKEIGADAEIAHRMRFWSRPLDADRPAVRA